MNATLPFPISHSRLRILLLEDSVMDANIIEGELKKGGFAFEVRRIETENDLKRELNGQCPDLVLSDHGFPSFDGFTALKMVRARHPKMPFIFVSGSNNQAMVADMHDRGATDYVFKNDIQDLLPAVRNALTAVDDVILESGTIDAIECKSSFAVEESRETGPEINRLTGKLTFCPVCFQVWDERELPVQIQSYCGTHAEITISNHLCSQCDSSAK